MYCDLCVLVRRNECWFEETIAAGCVRTGEWIHREVHYKCCIVLDLVQKVSKSCQMRNATKMKQNKRGKVTIKRKKFILDETR